MGLAPSPPVQTPSRDLSLRQATWPAGVQGYTASLWDTRGILVLMWNHEWEIRERLLVLGSNGNGPYDKDPSAVYLTTIPETCRGGAGRRA